MYNFKEKIIDVLIESNIRIKNIKAKVLNSDKDIVTNGDVEIGKFIAHSFLSIKDINILVETEEHHKQRNFTNGVEEFYVVIDDIDGTDNYYRGNHMLPYCSLIVIFENNSYEKGYNYTFSNIVFAGCIEHASGKIWYCEKGLGKIEIYDLNKKPVFLDVPQKIYNDVSKPVILTDIVSTDVSKLIYIFEKYWIKDFGCSAAAYCYIGSKLFDAYISSNKKSHELGLLYLFCNETNQILCDFNYKPYNNMLYNFEKNDYDVIAGDKKIVEELISKIGK